MRSLAGRRRLALAHDCGFLPLRIHRGRQLDRRHFDCDRRRPAPRHKSGDRRGRRGVRARIPRRRRHRRRVGTGSTEHLGDGHPRRPVGGALQAGEAGRRARRRPGRRGGQPDGKAGAAGHASSTCPEVSTTSTSSPAPPVTSKARPARSIPPITRRAFVVRRWESSRPSPRGTTRSRWRCGRCCPRWPPAARWSSSRAS